MTVAELIGKLSAFDDDDVVMYLDSSNDDTGPTRMEVDFVEYTQCGVLLY